MTSPSSVLVGDHFFVPATKGPMAFEIRPQVLLTLHCIRLSLVPPYASTYFRPDSVSQNRLRVG